MDADYDWDDGAMTFLNAAVGQESRAGLGLVGLFVLVFFLYNLYIDVVPQTAQAATTSTVISAAAEFPVPIIPEGTNVPVEQFEISSQDEIVWSEAEQKAFSAPYKKYSLTQGLHGQSYGHLAIDLAAGKGKPLLSPINGIVTERFIDEYQNTTLVIENDVYRVTLLHGKYSVNVGELVHQGEKIGVESNKGYVADINGVPCTVAGCGYHTHLNVFNKLKGKNVNPLNLIK